MDHLSPEWIAAFDDIVRHHAGLREATAASRLVIQYTVTDAPEEPTGTVARTGASAVEYALVLDHGDNRVVSGPATDPQISLRTDRRTAAAIASHIESAQTAFMAGRMRLGGDVRVLIASQGVLAEVDDCAGALRAITEFGTIDDRAARGA